MGGGLSKTAGGYKTTFVYDLQGQVAQEYGGYNRAISKARAQRNFHKVIAEVPRRWRGD
jgi:hypothetical protein